MKVEVIAAAVVKITDWRSAERKVETNPTTAANSIAGPKFIAGGKAYIITARNMKASAIDFWLCKTPVALVTGTVKRLAATVRISKATKGPRPVQPEKGRLRVRTTPSNSSSPPTKVTPAKRLKLFQFPFGIISSVPLTRKAVKIVNA